MASPSLLQSSASSFHGCFPSLAVPSSAPQLLRSVVKFYASGTVWVEKSEAEKVQRLKTVYLERIIPTLKDEFKYINIHQVMYSFLDRLISLALPRTRYFQSVSPSSFDGNGNCNIGVKDQSVFPEIRKARAMNVCASTTAKTDQERGGGASTGAEGKKKLNDSQDPSPELHRINGDFVSHGLRRNDYSSSPPTRGEFGRLYNLALMEDGKGAQLKIVDRVEETRSPQTVKSSKLAHLFLEEVDQDLSVSAVKKTNQRETSVDNQASQHLLSLLQRSADPKSQDTLLLSVTAGEANPGKSLTLENLFGSAFMNELQSIGGPVSVGSRFD
ncbi:hypothetical protein F2Q70_00016632 [Brassica cretica]|uniref:Large ribosomal subunit protein uL5 C-terminal domain-containing protein n=1 Tax=Brassica cretica TaxID=69181 RepID=A0A8S9L4K6_BRACR|nr:hypothetical protein F2Q70_00016632 [Brassica cretica]KAF2600827.1 hypothetical protein F2Q68_00009597 [Brassica cretica]